MTVHVLADRHVAGKNWRLLQSIGKNRPRSGWKRPMNEDAGQSTEMFNLTLPNLAK